MWEWIGFLINCYFANNNVMILRTQDVMIYVKMWWKFSPSVTKSGFCASVLSIVSGILMKYV